MQLSMFSLVTEAEKVHSKDKYSTYYYPYLYREESSCGKPIFQYIREGYLSRGRTTQVHYLNVQLSFSIARMFSLS